MPSDTEQNTVQRFDFVQIGKRVTTTPQGFLKIPARFTRTGIFTYMNADGTQTREYRPADEVFNAHSLSTYSNAPLTELHPQQTTSDAQVTPKNFKGLSAGWVGSEVKQDNDFVAGEVTVADSGAIDSVNAGRLKELSVGYRCQIEHTPGEINGQKYDSIQRNIIVNHVALLPAGQGRAGPDCALRLDASDAFLNSVHEMGDDVEAKTPEKNATVAELTARIDALEKELKAKDDAKADPNIFTEQTLKLSEMLRGAMKHLGTDYDFKGQRVHDVKKAVLGKLAANVDLTGKSDEYLDGMYDSYLSHHEDRPQSEELTVDPQVIVESQMTAPVEAQADSKSVEKKKTTETMTGDSLAMAHSLALSASLSKTERNDANSAYQAMLNRNANAWKEDLTFSKNKLFK